MSAYDPVSILQYVIDTYEFEELRKKFQPSLDLKNLFNNAFELLDAKVKQSYEFAEPKKKNFDAALMQRTLAHIGNGSTSTTLSLCNTLILNAPPEIAGLPLGEIYKTRAIILESLKLYESSLEDYRRSKEMGVHSDWKKMLVVAESALQAREDFWCSGPPSCLHGKLHPYSYLFPETEYMYEFFYKTSVQPQTSEEDYVNYTRARSQALRNIIQSRCVNRETTLVQSRLTELRYLELTQSPGFGRLVEYRGNSLVAVTDIMKG